MNISLQNIGKRFRFEWIFKEISADFEAGNGYAVMGNNGSGKSTFMQILSGHLSPSKGEIIYTQAQKNIPLEQVYKQLSFAAPYIELIEEFTLQESIDFHWKFKSMLLSKKELVDLLCYSKNALKKEVKYFSSGMQQRLKLALAICSDTTLLLLDEPTVTLDTTAVDWYHQLLQQYAYAPNRLTIIASNVDNDFLGCQNRLNILDFK